MTKQLVVAMAVLAWVGVAQAGTPKDEAAKARADIQKTLGFVPEYMKAVPDEALPGAWEEMKTLQANDSTSIPCKVKELIGLAVASQVPCKACVYGHTRIAKLSGASDQEVGEAVAMAALTRHWSTFFNGIQLDEPRFRADIKQITDGARKAMASGQQPPAPLELTDGKSALKDMEQSFGFVPDFAKKFPVEALPGAWREMRDVEMNPNTALAEKYKSLIGLAVSSQIPCRYCIVADTEFAKLAGASDAEVAEAIAMGALVRHWATLLEGTQVDEATYKRDYDKLVKVLSMAKGTKSASARP